MTQVLEASATHMEGPRWSSRLPVSAVTGSWGDSQNQRMEERLSLSLSLCIFLLFSLPNKHMINFSLKILKKKTNFPVDSILKAVKNGTIKYNGTRISG